VTLEAARALEAEGARIRVVAVPSWELFAEQDEAYRRSVLAPGVARRVAVEAASPFGWERFVGMDGTIIGMDRFGASAPAGALQERFGFTAKAIEAVFRQRLGRD
jgi:transketolase